ncbi:unnamed protein product [Hermetia illucens]|uniref:Uncharacterized protein n=1 Tax=Hermetia illucens TaxID=343691 RepID=A0A7R8UNP8_HERIL|nr:unnamed protein product [Hermetia illucens]
MPYYTSETTFNGFKRRKNLCPRKYILKIGLDNTESKEDSEVKTRRIELYSGLDGLYVNKTNLDGLCSVTGKPTIRYELI